MARAAPMLIWCFLVLAGTVFLVLTARTPAPKALHDLPMNTYLLPGDLSNSENDGRYVIVPKGVIGKATLTSGDIADQPNLLDGPHGKLLALINVDRPAVAGGLNAGSAIQLCGSATTTYGGVTVQAVHCESGNVNRCVAMIDLPQSFAADVVTKGLKDQTTAKELRLAQKCS